METMVVWIIRTCFVISTGLVIVCFRNKKKAENAATKVEGFIDQRDADKKIESWSISFYFAAFLAVVSFAASLWTN